jgi:hypothetical protein
MLDPFNVEVRIPYATTGDKIERWTWTNAKHSGEPRSRPAPEIVASQGDCFTFSFREPMMPLCRNGLTGIEGC